MSSRQVIHKKYKSWKYGHNSDCSREWWTPFFKPLCQTWDKGMHWRMTWKRANVTCKKCLRRLPSKYDG